MPGSESDPVSLDPFRTIVEVGWPGNWYVSIGGGIDHEASAVMGCSPALFPSPDSAQGTTHFSTYVKRARFAPSFGNGSGVTLQNTRNASTKSGTLSGVPGFGPWVDLAPWAGVNDPARVSVTTTVGAGTAAIRHGLMAPQGGEQRCYQFPVGGLWVEALNEAEIYAASGDYGTMTFTETSTGDVYEAIRAVVADGGDARIFMRKIV